MSIALSILAMFIVAILAASWLRHLVSIDLWKDLWNSLDEEQKDLIRGTTKAECLGCQILRSS
jgi:hypothetical protein